MNLDKSEINQTINEQPAATIRAECMCKDP
jgi:hypothetical protein